MFETLFDQKSDIGEYNRVKNNQSSFTVSSSKTMNSSFDYFHICNIIEYMLWGDKDRQR